MIEAAETCQRNMFSKLKSLSNVTLRLRIVSDGVIRDGRREEASKFAALSGCTYNDEICFVGFELKSIVCHPEISPR